MTIPNSGGKVSPHRFKFFRAGGFDQVRLDTGADLAALDQLDQKLWVALACPAKGLEFDTKTLELIDLDSDGRIRAPEILAAVKWACSVLKDPGSLIEGSASLPLSAIDAGNDEGKKLLASAKSILKGLGKPDAKEITLEDTADTERIFASTRFNGDGIIPVESTQDEAVAAAIRDAMACVGSLPDRSGLPGLNGEKLEEFFAAAQAYSDWRKVAEDDAANVLPLGDGTAAGVAAVDAIAGKVQDFFTRCGLAGFSPGSADALNRANQDFGALAGEQLAPGMDALRALPLAHAAAGASLSLVEGVNPSWAGEAKALRGLVVTPLLGERDSITETDWAAIRAKFGPWRAWAAAKAGAAVESLGVDRVRELLASDAKTRIEELLEMDRALEAEADAIDAVDRLVHYHRDLVKLLNNFVTFRDFYGRRDKAIFQAGTLYFDQRSCDLCVRVPDLGRHATLAGLAKACLAYCTCTRPATGETMTIAAAFTGGDSDYLIVGRNGIFYDREGRDWDATITKIIDNPISIRQAFWSPYKRFVRMLEERAAKRAAEADSKSMGKLDSAATSVVEADKGGKPAEPKKIDVGAVAAMGVAVGAIGAAIAAFAGALAGLEWWKIPLVFIVILLIISTPSMVIAALKLRQRNLGPILDANGWAVNAKAKLNIPFGGSLTKVASLPPGSTRDLRDPWAEKKSFGRRVFEWLVILAIVLGVVWGLYKFGVVRKVWPKADTWIQENIGGGPEAVKPAETDAAK